MQSRGTARRVAAAIFSTTLVAGSLAGNAGAVAAQDPVVFRIGTTQAAKPVELNPFRVTSGAGYLFLADRYDLLVAFGPDLGPAPGLAETWDVSADGLTWTYTMREGVTWHDGRPFTAEDARFTLQYIIDSHDPDYRGPLAPDGNKKPRGGAANPVSLYDNYLDLNNGLRSSAIETIEAPDDRTLVITTSEPLGTLPMVYIPILPKHIWRDITFEQAATGRISVEQAIGTGPYQLVSWEPKQAVVSRAHDGYWAGRPQIDELIYQYFDNDEAQINALKSGAVDLLDNFPPGLMSALESDPNITLVVSAGQDFGELGFNSWDPSPDRFEDEGCADCPKGPTTGSMGDPWITRPEVRAAIAGLIDKAALIDYALAGQGTPGISVVPPRDPVFAYTPAEDHPASFPAYTDDAGQDAARETAKGRFTATMASLGFADTDGNGILNVPDTDDARAFDPDGAGRDWSLRLFVREDDEEDKLAGELIEVWLEEAGVDVALEQISEDPRLYEVTYPSSSNADMDLYIWGWGPDPDPDFMLSTFTCAQINNWQDANYCDPAYDDLYAQQHRTADREARGELVRQMQDKLYSEAPYAVLWYIDTLQAYRSDRFTGFTQLPADGGAIWSALGFGPYESRLSVAPVAP